MDDFRELSVFLLRCCVHRTALRFVCEAYCSSCCVVVVRLYAARVRGCFFFSVALSPCLFRWAMWKGITHTFRRSCTRHCCCWIRLGLTCWGFTRLVWLIAAGAMRRFRAAELKREIPVTYTVHPKHFKACVSAHFFFLVLFLSDPITQPADAVSRETAGPRLPYP